MLLGEEQNWVPSTTWCSPFWNIPKKSLGKQLPIVGWDPGFGRGSHFSHPVDPGTQESAGQTQFSSLRRLQPFSGAPRLPPTPAVWEQESLCFSKPRTFGDSASTGHFFSVHTPQHTRPAASSARGLWEIGSVVGVSVEAGALSHLHLCC